MLRIIFAVAIGWIFSLTALAGVNVNSASLTELESLPGIGPAKAAAIINFRSDNGPFRNLADLDAVPGIGPATLANLTPLVSFFGETEDTPVAANDSTTPQPSIPAATVSVVNVNKADISALEALPGIGPVKAAAIVADRQANGPYASCSQLQRVRGIGPATVASIGPRCTINK